MSLSFYSLEVAYFMVTWVIHPSQVSNGVEDKIVIASLVMIEIKLGTKFWIHQERIYNGIFPLNLTNINGLYNVNIIFI